MKIEKISDNQIRCTLSKEDLEQRQIRLSELAYGSEKARRLFRDMLMEAFEQCGFSNENNIPLMIEAIPDREQSLVVVITRVEDPEELDTRFAKFSATNVLPDGSGPQVEGADDILDAVKKYIEAGKAAARQEGAQQPKSTEEQPPRQRPGGPGRPHRQAPPVLTRMYRFKGIDDVIRAAAAVKGFYKGKNTLYHLRRGGSYILVLHQSSHTPEEYNKVCNIMTEYSRNEKFSAAAEAHYSEHEDTVIADGALQELAELG